MEDILYKPEKYYLALKYANIFISLVFLGKSINEFEQYNYKSAIAYSILTVTAAGAAFISHIAEEQSRLENTIKKDVEKLINETSIEN